MKLSLLKSTFKVKFNDEKLSKLVLPSNLTKVMLSTEKQPTLNNITLQPFIPYYLNNVYIMPGHPNQSKHITNLKAKC